MCPYLGILDRVISTKVIHPNIAIFSPNIWSFKRSISWWPLPKTSTTSGTELWDQLCTCVLKGNSFFSYRVRYYTMQNHKAFWSSLKIMYQSCAWVLQLRWAFSELCFWHYCYVKWYFSCIHPHKNTEGYPVMLSHSIKEIAPEFDGCSSFGLIIRKNEVLRSFHL